MAAAECTLMGMRARYLMTGAGLLFSMADARAAGGHFDVDDATVLDPGHCQYETWIARTPGAALTFFHLGPACRVGPIEIGMNIDRYRSGLRTGSDVDESHTNVGPQLKMVADPLFGRVSAGVAWNASFDVTHGGKPYQSAYVPVTWWAAERLWLHANAGADWLPSGEHTRRLGLSAEWSANDRWSFIAERITFYRDWTSRIGARFNLNDSISIDFSVARTGPDAIRMYVIGLNHDFDVSTLGRMARAP
jgi:hypothetical protein